MTAIQSLREKSVAELKKELYALLREKTNLNLQKGISETLKPHLHKAVRKNIARVKTVLTEKSRGVE